MIVIHKIKIIKYLVCFLFIITLISNGYLIHENNRLKSQMGAKYLMTVKLTLFELDENTALYLENELKKQNGDLVLERYVGKLRVLSEDYHHMNGKLAIIGTQIDYCISQLYELKNNIQNRRDTKEIHATLSKNISFIDNVLTTVNKKLGDDEKRWYEEFIHHDSKTVDYIWKKFKEFNHRN